MSDPRRHRLARGPLTPLVTALAVAAALLVPLAGVAHAQTLTSLNVTAEDADTEVGLQHEVKIILRDENRQEIVAPDAVNVDIEVDGPNDPQNDGFSPDSPDEPGCTIAAGASRCTRHYLASVVGTDTVYAWVDSIGADTSPDVDSGEVPADEDDDFTDVVVRSAFDPVAASLNCTEKATAEDGSDITLQCQTDARQASILIDAENLNGGANDPDNGTDIKTADYNDCTTDSFGACTVTIPQSDGETGSANLCLWVDEEDDQSYHPGRIPQRDGALCDAPGDVEGLGAEEEANITDVVQLGWGDRRDLTIGSPTATKKYGGRFTLSGTIKTDDASCKPGVTVSIQRDKLGGAVNFVGWKQDQTGANGNYSLSATAYSSARYRAVIADETPCLGDVSGAKIVRVAKKVTIGASDRSVQRGQIVRIHGKVAPCKSHKRKRVFLQRKRGGVFRRVATAKTNGSCRATFSRTIGQTTVFRIRAKKTGPAYEAGTSPGITVRAT